MTTRNTSFPNNISKLQNVLPNGIVSTDPTSLAATANCNPVLPAGRPPTCLIQPANADDLQAVIALANEVDLNLTIASSTGAHRNGGITNPNENVLIDLSHWRKIDLIDRRNRVCRIEPGVTYSQLIVALAEHGMTLPLPLAPRSGKSVLASVMDRTPTTWPNKQWDASDPVGSTEFFFGNGERFRSGAAGGPGTIEQQRQSGGAQKFPSGPSQTDFHRVVQGAQGTLGLLTWITIRTELKASLQKTLLIGREQLEDLVPFIYAVQRGTLGEQTFILDRTAAAILLANGNKDTFYSLGPEFPAFICMQNIAGFDRLPQERLGYHLHDINELAIKYDLCLLESIGPISAADLFTMAAQPCGEIDWRDALLGSSLSIFFISTLNRMPSFRRIFMENALEFGIPEGKVGTYIQPIAQNHACHMEFIIPFSSSSEVEIECMKQFERQVVSRLMEAGAFFSRPYGSAADLVWKQNPANYQLVKIVKGIFDPRGVLQRGKWGL